MDGNSVLDAELVLKKSVDVMLCVVHKDIDSVLDVAGVAVTVDRVVLRFLFSILLTPCQL